MHKIKRPVSEPVPPTLEELKAQKIRDIDAEAASDLAAGFDYAVDGMIYHFAYDPSAAQDFSDTAIMSSRAQTGEQSVYNSVIWNAYAPDGSLVRLTFDAVAFLDLYVRGAMTHKATVKERAGSRKAAVEAAATREEVESA